MSESYHTGQMKYIVIEKMLLPAMILFPDIMQHSEVVGAMGPAVSAGFIEIKAGRGKCFGESISLGITSDEEDSEIATLQIFGL